MKKFLLLLSPVLLLIAALKIAGIRFHYTNSMPIGFYERIQTTKIANNDLAAVCLPNSISKVGLERRYIARGTCHNGSTPVLKKVIAIPGDSVFLSNLYIVVNHVSYTAPFQSRDRHNYIVKKWIKNGGYKNINSYWLYGANDPLYSWDSRYYGGVKKSNIIGIYKPLLTL